MVFKLVRRSIIIDCAPVLFDETREVLHDLCAQDLDFALFIDVSVRVENPTKLDSNGALDRAFAQHCVRQLELLVLGHIVCQEVLEEGLGAFRLFFFELAQVFRPHFEERLELVIYALLLLSSELVSDSLQLDFAELEPGLAAAIFWTQSKLKAHCVGEVALCPGQVVQAHVVDLASEGLAAGL